MRLMPLFRLFYLDIFCVLLLIVADSLLKIFAQPTIREALKDDFSIKYPHKEEIVTIGALRVYCMLIPTVLIILHGLFTKKSKENMLVTLLGIGISFSFTLFTSSVLKYTVGRLRPDFIARCQPNEHITGNIYGECINRQNLPEAKFQSSVRNGRVSFVSSHASCAFAGLLYLSLYLAGQIKLLSFKGFVHKALICLLPLIAATLICVSRVVDNHHHPTDVIAGALLGSVFAYFGYRQYFPPLKSEFSDCTNDRRSLVIQSETRKKFEKVDLEAAE